MITFRTIVPIAIGLSGCGASVHEITVDASGGYATELVPVAIDAVARGARQSLPQDVVCLVDVALDAGERGRAGAGDDGAAGSMMSIDVSIQASCDGTRWRSDGSLTVVSGPNDEHARAALDSATERVCLLAARQLEPTD